MLTDMASINLIFVKIADAACLKSVGHRAQRLRQPVVVNVVYVLWAFTKPLGAARPSA